MKIMIKYKTMTNEEKAQEIVNKHWEWLADFLERNNLSKEDRNQIRFKTYEQCLEMAEWKDEQHEQSLIDLNCKLEEQQANYEELKKRYDEAVEREKIATKIINELRARKK